MAEITRRRNGELVRGIFSILLPVPEGMPAAQVLNDLEKRVPPTSYESGQYESGGRRYEKIVRFATVDCVKAGWLRKDHGRWLLTDDGRSAFAKFPDPEDFYRRASQLYKEWRRDSKVPVVDPNPLPTIVEVETASITFEEAEEQAWSEIEKHLTSMRPYDFQELVAALLRGMGYYVGWVAPPGKDGGIDITAYNDPLGTRPPRMKVQVKRQQSKVSVEGLRSFMALLGTTTWESSSTLADSRKTLRTKRVHSRVAG